MRHLYIITIFIFNGFLVQAQIPTLDYLTSFENTSDNIIFRALTDFDDNLIVVGQIGDTLTDGSNDTLFSTGLQDLYLQKYNKDGQLLWQHSVPDMGYQNVRELTFDENNSIYIAGKYESEFFFIPGDSSTFCPQPQGDDAYIAKFDGDGNYIWKSSFIATFETDLRGLHYNNGILYASGQFLGDLALESDDTLFSSSGREALLVLLNPSDGSIIDYRSWGSTGNDGFGELTTTNTNQILIGGYHTYELNFESTSTDFIVYPTGTSINGFTLLLNSDLSVNAVHSITGTGIDYVGNVAVDANNGFYVSGYHGDSTVFDSNTIIESIGVRQTFIIKYNPDLTINWMTSFGGKGVDFIEDIAVRYNQLWASGYVSDTVVTSTGDTLGMFSSDSDFNGIIQLYDLNGNRLFNQVFGGNQQDRGISICIDSEQSIYMAGRYSDNADFDFESGVNSPSANGSFYPYIAKYNSVCPANDLTITVDSTFIQVDTALLSVGNYQWYDCGGNDLQEISGATENSYLLTNADDSLYLAVIFESNNVCTDTSSCALYFHETLDTTSTSIQNAITEKIQLLLRPNPSSGVVHLSSKVALVKIECYNLLGTLLLSENYDRTLQTQFNLPTDAGLYILNITLENGVRLEKRVLKE